MSCTQTAMTTDDPETPTGPPPPRPGLCKTIGVLNLLLGGFLLLCGAGCLNTLLPFLLRNNPPQLDPAEARRVVEQMRLEEVNRLKDAEQSAATEAEREKLRRSRAELAAKPWDIEAQVDFKKVNNDLPWLARYLWADVVTGPVLNLLLLVSGVGLILLKGWGRTLALWTAGLKILRLLLLNLFLAV